MVKAALKNPERFGIELWVYGDVPVIPKELVLPESMGGFPCDQRAIEFLKRTWAAIPDFDALPKTASIELCERPDCPELPGQLWEKKTFSDGSVEWSIPCGIGCMDSRAGILLKSE